MSQSTEYKKVFICSPFRGNVALNIERCRGYCRFACKNHYIPFAPHLFYPQFLRDNVESERKLGIHHGIEMLKLCDEMWVFRAEDKSITEGMQAEIEQAKALNMRIKFFRYNYAIELFGLDIDAFEERAAIIQYESNISRTEAEIKALDCL